MEKPILCVDFDGVIHSYTSGWQGADVILDPPVPGALAWLRKAMEHWEVNIYSSRSKDSDGINAMVSWLQNFAAHEWGIDEAKRFVHDLVFPTQKPAAFLTIDDRAICFQGKWDDLDPVELLGFKPWNKR
jgi:hypothetical protein